MAARKNKIRHDENTRLKIKAGQLTERLQNHALGFCEMTPTQVKAAEICLRKIMPDLSMVESNSTVEHRYVARVPDKAASPQDWLEKNVGLPAETQH
jgi:hypothetical protein